LARTSAGAGVSEDGGMSETVTCPYCQIPTYFLANSAPIYGKDYGPIYQCARCGARCGCHKGTTRPLGRPANAALRELRKDAHALFDPIWQRRWKRMRAVDPGYTMGHARGGRYKKLAQLLGIAQVECHIALFDEGLCKRAIEIIKSGALEQETEITSGTP
jgi:zinc-finger-containing domain